MSRCGCRQKEDDSWGTEKIFALNENIHWESWISDMKRERPETENKNVKTKFEKKLDIKQHEKETSITTTKVQIKDINPAKIDDNNYSEIESLMTIRAKNTMAEASKSELNKELNIWKKLNDYL